MKKSGIEWIGDIPDDWFVRRLKYLAKIELSSVDRHENDDETVQICHYPDVYKNEKITNKTELGFGTCKPQELEKFRLKDDDVLITKDSETPDDIGVPCLVLNDMENTVCGYHIAQITTYKKQILGRFLFRYLQSHFSNAFFEINSNGVTRFGLGKGSIGDLPIVFPSTIDKQEQIFNFLDKEIAKIDTSLSNNQKLILLLQEKRQNLVDEIVRTGIDSTVSMKKSGINWFGDIPNDWKLIPVKYLVQVPVCDGPHETPIFQDEGIPFFSVDSIQENKLIFKNPRYISNEDHIRFSKKCKPQKFDILLGKAASVGKVALVETDEEFNIWSPLAVIRLKKEFDPKFYFYYMISSSFQNQIFLNINFNTQGNIGMTKIENLLFIRPPTKKIQESISFYLDKETTKIDDMCLKIKSLIKKLQEYRQSLILSTVTGKIDMKRLIV